MRRQTRAACWVLAALVASPGCYPHTTRPGVAPLPQSSLLELRLPIPDATRNLALALDKDSIPVARTEPADGWLETDWFDAASLQTTTRRPVGEGVVKLRAWVNPSKPLHSCVTVEVVYRPLADPSRDGRLLERLVSDSHRVAKRVAKVLADLEVMWADGDPTPSCATAKPDTVTTGRTP